MGLVVVRPQTLGPASWSPGRTALGLDGERPELVEREGAVPFVLEHGFDAGQLLFAQGIRRLLPGLGGLEGDVLLSEDLAEPLGRDHDPLATFGGQIARELAHAPASE